MDGTWPPAQTGGLFVHAGVLLKLLGVLPFPAVTSTNLFASTSLASLPATVLLLTSKSGCSALMRAITSRTPNSPSRCCTAASTHSPVCPLALALADGTVDAVLIDPVS